MLRNENNLYGIILIHLTWTISLKTRNRLLVAWYRILKKFPNCLTASLTTVTSLEPKRKGAQPPFYATTANSPVGCVFWGSDKWGTSLFLLSSIRLFFFYMQQNHTDVLIFPINTFFEQCIKCTTSILKCLHYSRTSTIIWVQNETVTKRLPRPSFGEVFLQRHFDGN